MQTYLNQTGVPLSMAVYFAHDSYDRHANTISATGLLKSIRQAVITPRIPTIQQSVDVLDVVKSRTGTAVHDGVERAWSHGNHREAMRKLGYNESLIDRIVVNHAKLLTQAGYNVSSLEKNKTYISRDPLPSNPIPVYMEIRGFRQFMGKTISGKFDFIGDGGLEDTKTTSAFSWIYGSKTEDYQLQGSIYRWLHQNLVTRDVMTIQFIFTDWSPGKAKQEKHYPQRITEKLEIPLLDISDTEDFIRDKLTAYELHKDEDEVSLPSCTDKELWRKDPVFKYYKNPASRKRSTKNFTTAQEAHTRLIEDGNVGIVVQQPGEVIACRYCSAFAGCSQKDRLIADGSLKL